MTRKNFSERAIWAVAYCRRYGWNHTRDHLWQLYHGRTITAKQLIELFNILHAKGF